VISAGRFDGFRCGESFGFFINHLRFISDCSNDRLLAPFETWELFSSRFTEIVIAEAINDGIDASVEASHVARNKEQITKPFGNLKN